MTKDMKRQELIRALKEGRLTPDQISGFSEDQRLTAELLREFGFAGANRLIDAPETVIRKAEAIFETARQSFRIRALLAKLVFDSWAMPLPAGVRGSATADERRLRFEAEPYTFDVRVEKQAGTYHFTAEVYGPEGSIKETAIVADSKKIHAGSEGLFEWSSARPPRKLALVVGDGEPVVLPEVSWNRPLEK